MKKLSSFIILTFLINLGLILAFPGLAAGATLFFSPAKGSYEIDKTFSVKVMVDSGGGLGINAADGSIKFDPEYLSVSGVDNSGSVFKLWVAEPSFSNSNGTISFSGGLPGAYKGNAGAIFTITFKAKKVGETKVSFTGGAVLAPDGKGTNVLSRMGSAIYTITEKKEAPKKEIKKTKPKTEEKKPQGMLPPLPDVSSPTHPKEDVWYANNDPEFQWKLLPDLNGVSLMITHSPTSDPGPNLDGIIESKKYEDVEDGEWYFHIKYKNQFGFGKIVHRKFLVDVTPPESFKIILDNQGDVTNPSPVIKFSTKDETSGLDHYKLTIDTEEKELNANDFKDFYKLDVLFPGDHRVNVAAFDKAGNAASSTLNFFIEPLKAPVITDIPKIISKRDELIVRGASFYPNVEVKIYIASAGKDPEEFSTKTDNEGNWAYFHNSSLEKGNYEVWAKIIDSRGAQSLDSAKHVLTVTAPSILEAYGWIIIITLLIIVIILVLYITYLRHKFNEERLRIKREVKEAKLRLTEIFTALREEVDELMELADKKAGLSESERRVKEKLEEALDISEEFLDKEIEDVEKEIKLKNNNHN